MKPVVQIAHAHEQLDRGVVLTIQQIQEIRLEAYLAGMNRAVTMDIRPTFQMPSHYLNPDRQILKGEHFHWGWNDELIAHEQAILQKVKHITIADIP